MSNGCKYVLKKEHISGIKKKGFSNLNSRNSILMEKLIIFYLKTDNLNCFLDIVNNKSKLSLRIIDFFITNYARDNKIIYEVNNNKFLVYYDYKKQLKSFSKKQFDPFCRRERILFFINEYNETINGPIETTVAQLNFFRWAIENKILDYILENYKKIEFNMNNKENKLSLVASKKIIDNNITITVKFNK